LLGVAISGDQNYAMTAANKILSITPPSQEAEITSFDESVFPRLQGIAVDYWDTDNLVYSTTDGNLHRPFSLIH
jgi:hypothetical protein